MIQPPRSLTDPWVIVYHQCATAATGSVMGPHDALAYWWATQEGLRLLPAEPMTPDRRTVLEQAVLEHLGGRVAGDAVRRHQDELAEALDL